MRYTEFKKILAESEQLQLQKSELIQKIQNIGTDPKSVAVIDKITQLLNDVGVGGRVQSLLARVEKIDDNDVQKAVNKIAKMVSTVDFDTAGREKLFKLWNADKIVNKKVLTTGGIHNMSDIFVGYGKDPAMTELVDDFNDVIAQGIGPGEFTLAVLSKGISGIGAGAGSGDLVIDGLPVELKAKRVKNARFTDRSVSVTAQYPGLVDKFLKKYANDISALEQQGLRMRSNQGMNLGQLGKLVQTSKKKQIVNDVTTILSNVFPGVKGVERISNALIKDSDSARLLYGKMNIQYYLATKRAKGDLLGILFIDLGQKTYTFAKNVSDLTKSGLSLDVNTAYPLATTDPANNPYPQIGLLS